MGVTELKDKMPKKGSTTQDSGDEQSQDQGEIDPIAEGPKAVRAKKRKQAEGENTRPDDGVKQGAPPGKNTKRGRQENDARAELAEEERSDLGGENRKGTKESSGEGEREGRETRGTSTEMTPHGAGAPSVGPPSGQMEAVQPTTVSVEASQRRRLSVFTSTGIDLNKERKKRGILPSYACSTCTLSAECPEFQEGYICAFEGAFSAFPVRDIDGVLEMMRDIVETNKKRLAFARLSEVLSSGGMANPEVTHLSDVVMRQGKQLLDLEAESQKVTLTVQGPINPGPSGAAPAPMGILSRLFSNQTNTNTPIDVPVIDVAGESVEVLGRDEDVRGEEEQGGEGE